MFGKLLLLFTLVPMTELYLLIKLGGVVGFPSTVALVALTGVIGVSLARNQGFLVISEIQSSLSKGQLPADSLVDGLLILLGGAMLLTPGLLTDITGFSFVIPGTRKIVRRLAKEKLENHINKGNIKFSFFGPSQEQSNYQQQDQQGWQETEEQDDEWDDTSESIDVEFEELNEKPSD